MITIYKENDGWIEPTEQWRPGSWVHVEEPSEANLEELHRQVEVPKNFVRSALDPREVARTDSERDAHLVIVRAPYDFGEDDRVPFRSIPLAMIVTPNHFVTICRQPIDFVRDLNYSYEDEELPTHRAGRMILAILGVVAEWYLLYLEEVDRRLEEIENQLKDSIENSEMLDLLRYEKSLVYIKTGLEWNQKMIDHLEEKKAYNWNNDDRQLFHDVRVEYSQGYQMAATMLEVLEASTDAFASLISNNLNVVMKFLAAITIVLTIPTIISSIYGMNVALPGDDQQGIFFILMLLALGISLGVAAWFRARRWLSFRWRRPSKKRREVDDVPA